MEKTKLGVSAGFLCAAAYLLFLFGGYTPALLLVGYILICENDETLRISALTATILALAFSLLNLLIGLLPDILNIFESMLDIFNVYLNLNLICFPILWCCCAMPLMWCLQFWPLSASL